MTEEPAIPGEVHPPVGSRRRPRILVVGPLPPPFGGIARYVEDLLASRLSRDFQLSHFNTSFSSKVRSHAVNFGHRRYETGRDAGLSKYAYVFGSGLAQGVKTLLAGVLSVFRMAWQAARTRPELVHVFANMHWGFWRAGAMVLSARILRRRVIFHPLGAIEQFYPSCGPVGRWFIRFLLNRSDLVLVQSPGLAALVQPMTRRQVQGIFNGILLEPFDQMSERDSPEGDPGEGERVVFLAVGDLGHNKGTWDILAVGNEVRRRVPGAVFWFVGRGELEDLERRAHAAGMGGAVRFLGSVGDREKIEAFHEADVFLLPSYAEGQPLSILEAMAAGLPVISTPVGSIAEVIQQDVNGILVKPGDLQGLTRAMVDMGKDRTLRREMGQENRRAACEKFSSARLWNDLEGAWNLVLGRRPS